MNKITEVGMQTLKKSYLKPNETIEDRFHCLAKYYSNSSEQAMRMYSYMIHLQFMPSTPILSCGGRDQGYPISCYENVVGDSISKISENWRENSVLSANGGGLSSYWGNVRSMYETTRFGGNSSGIIPFIKVQDSISLAINQGGNRAGACAVYLDVFHPEIEEFLMLRNNTGDIDRRAPNLHIGVCIPDYFMQAVLNDTTIDLIGPYSKLPTKTIRARALWEKILQTRLQTGEPYIFFNDNANTNPIYNKNKTPIIQSNLCTEIMQPTGLDYDGKNRTAVCCLGSINLLNWNIKPDKSTQVFIHDCIDFLDKVLEDFEQKIKNNPSMEPALRSVILDHSIGLGVMGWHSYLQKHLIPFESPLTYQLNRDIFSTIGNIAAQYNTQLGFKKPCRDSERAGIPRRFTNVTAIAPTASISTIAGECSPSIEPISSNYQLHKTINGGFIPRKNKQLEAYFQTEGLDTPEVWNSILEHNGSVQHLNFLPNIVLDTYKTAYELPQKVIIEQAIERQHFIDQGQPVNLFVKDTIHKRELNDLHINAWKGKLKSLYYIRVEKTQSASFIKQEGCAACQ